MKKLFCILSVIFSLDAAHAEFYYDDEPNGKNKKENLVILDTEDPLYIEKRGYFLSRTGLTVGSDVFNAYERISYGFTDKFNLSADIKYQENFNNHDDGLSHVGFRASYRTGTEEILSDIFAGVNFNGQGASLPQYANTVYSVGARAGKRWNWITLAGTLQTSWIFHENYGMAYIDLIPEVYFRMGETWVSGLGADLRKSTRPSFDQEWLNVKLGKRYGHTMYMGVAEYELEHSETRFGLRINILF